MNSCSFTYKAFLGCFLLDLNTMFSQCTFNNETLTLILNIIIAITTLVKILHHKHKSRKK